jgi:Tfp pilus assembly protein FimT
MSPADLDALARDLESQARFSEAESVRLRIVTSQVSAEIGRAARDAEASGDWRRWSWLLALSGSVKPG